MSDFDSHLISPFSVFVVMTSVTECLTDFHNVLWVHKWPSRPKGDLSFDLRAVMGSLLDLIISVLCKNCFHMK